MSGEKSVVIENGASLGNIADEFYNNGFKLGFKQGRKDCQRNIVLNMHRSNYDLETIADLCGLKEGEVEAIIIAEKSMPKM